MDEAEMNRENAWWKRFDTIVCHAWEAWTRNGIGLDDDDRLQTTKSVKDAVNNSYQNGMNDTEWLAATLERLSHKDDEDQDEPDEEAA